LWPRSYGLVEGQPEFSDLHNLRPADTNVNSSRGNKFFGDCTLSKVKSCMVPAHQEAAPDTATDFNSWTPPAQVRGDVARALLYMAVRYGSEQPSGILSLALSDSPSMDKI
jgi:endonuclease I